MTPAGSNAGNGSATWHARLLVAFLLVATLGQGGASPAGLLAVHGCLVGLLVALLLGPSGGRAGGRLARGPLAAFALFAGAVIAGAVVAPYGYAAFTLMLEIAAFLAVGGLAARTGPSLARVASLALLAGGAVQGALAVYQRVVTGEPRAAGTFLNPNHLAAWLAAALLLGLGSLGPAPTARRLIPRLALALPALVGIALSGSRGAVVGLVVGAVSLAWAWRRQLGRRGRWAVAAGALVVVITAGVGAALRSSEADPFRYHRLKIWEASLGAVVADPWTGVGPRQWDGAANNLNFPLEQGPLRFERRLDSTHSDLLRLPCELGWPATIAALFALGLAVREMRRTRRGAGVGYAIHAADGALMALAAQAVVDNLSDRPAVYLLAAALLGTRLARSSVSARRPALTVRIGLAALLVGVFVVGDVAPYKAWRLGADLPRGRLGAAERDRLATALRHNPLHPGLWLRRAEDLIGDGSDLTYRSYAEAREAAERAARLQPADARYALGLARVEQVAFFRLFGDHGSRARAVARFDAASSLRRHDPFVPIWKGEFLLAARDPDGARRAAERALALEPACIPAGLLLAESLLASAMPEAAGRAERLVEEAEEVASRWSDHPKPSRYARDCLTLDDRRVEALRVAIARARAPSAADDLPDGDGRRPAALSDSAP